MRNARALVEIVVIRKAWSEVVDEKTVMHDEYDLIRLPLEYKIGDLPKREDVITRDDVHTAIQNAKIKSKDVEVMIAHVPFAVV